MTTRLKLSGMVAVTCVLLRAADAIAGEGSLDRTNEPPTARAVWPARLIGGDLFTSRKVDPAVVLKSEDSNRKASIDSRPPFVLMAVRADEGELRLIGHTGAGRSLRGVFALPGGGSVLARTGEPVGTEGLTVRAMELRRVREEGETVRRARAVLVREISGELVTLDATASSERSVALRAVLRSIHGEATSEVTVGDRLERDGLIYVVGRMSLQPPAVEIGWTDSAGAERSVALSLPEASGRSAP